MSVISDTKLFSEGLASLLAKERSVSVLDRASGAQVVLLDGRMEGVLDRCTALVDEKDGARVLIVAARSDAGWTAQALRAGARGVVPAACGLDVLIRAIRVVEWGQFWAPGDVAAATGLPGGSAEGPVGERVLIDRGLTCRERAVCRDAAAGLSNKQIADRLFISTATVKVHLTRVYQKLGLRTRAQLAATWAGVTPLRDAGAASAGPAVS